MSLAENIYKFRTEQNMSQLDLADALEVSRQSVSKWETGAAVPELEKLIKMSDLFDVSLDVLVGRSTSEPGAPAPPVPSDPIQKVVSWIARMTPRQFVSGIFFFCAFLFLLYCLTEDNLLIIPIFVFPLLLCGIICLVCQRHPALWCTWVLVFPYLLLPYEQFLRPAVATVGELFFRVPLLAFTVLSFRKEKMELTKGIKNFLGFGWSIWFIWFSMWLGSLNAPPELFEGFSVSYLLEVLMFPLFTALLTTTIRVFTKK